MRIYGLSIVMVLILLCLTVFGVLSLASAQAERTLSEKNAEHLTQYALCDAEAQRMLAEVHAAAASIDQPRKLPALLDAMAYSCTVLDNGQVAVRYETARQGQLSITVELTVGPGRDISVESYRLNVQTDGAVEQPSLWQG